MNVIIRSSEYSSDNIFFKPVTTSRPSVSRIIYSTDIVTVHGCCIIIKSHEHVDMLSDIEQSILSVYIPPVPNIRPIRTFRTLYDEFVTNHNTHNSSVGVNIKNIINDHDNMEYCIDYEFSVVGTI